MDLSTQSLSATILQQLPGHSDKDTELRSCGSWSIAFRDVAGKYALDPQNLCLLEAARSCEGFFAQPPQMFLASLDLLLAKMQAAGAPLASVDALNCSAQQHGQVWLNRSFADCCAALQRPQSQRSRLPELFARSYGCPVAPIWMCSQTQAEAGHLLGRLGKERVLELSGSAAPLRFSGLVLRWLALREPAMYGLSVRIHLLSSWLAAVLSAQSSVPLDWGSAAGTSLMDYRRKCWSEDLLDCLAEGLEGGPEGLRARLPELCPAQQCVGTLAPYFGKYGLRRDCLVLAGSGDNPQTKVAQQGDLLSLGSSFVLMSQASGCHEWANAMYDGLDRPFSFACRSNGALVWDAWREQLGLSLAQQDELLAQYPPGSVEPLCLRLLNESFPPGPATHPAIEKVVRPYTEPGKNLAAVIDGTLQELHQACVEVFGPGREVLYVTGGPARSPQILRRIEEFWQRPVRTFHSAGASYGAARRLWRLWRPVALPGFRGRSGGARDELLTQPAGDIHIKAGVGQED
ncbi:uncharacterized protein LOC133177593 [Saccostrea echinata]|uniref:uncharacterized protein LOC133177593 n=1 Tax=Saccostrea echinata TaxID=191078 RepID=UPI002A80CDD0|nr:uncharacterized protein LOC133177593 [Saccostrea echinata]